MKNAMLSSMKQVSWIRAIVGVLVMIVVLVFASTDSLIQMYREQQIVNYGYHTNLILAALESDATLSFLPIVAVLPFSAVYIDDVKSKFARFFLVRTNYTSYIVSRVLVCFFSGGIVIVSGTLLTWILFAILLPMKEIAEGSAESTNLLLINCLLLLLNGGLWAVIGMSMSTLMESKYISYATPFVFYYLLVILYERYFPGLFIIYPKMWTSPSAWPFGCLGAFCFLMEITLLFVLLFAFRAERRLRQL